MLRLNKFWETIHLNSMVTMAVHKGTIYTPTTYSKSKYLVYKN